MKNKQYFTVSEVAQMLGISRIAVFKKIKKGEIKAEKIGRNFAIDKKELEGILGQSLTDKQKKVIDQAIKKTTKEYGEMLKLLGDA